MILALINFKHFKIISLKYLHSKYIVNKKIKEITDIIFLEK